MKRATVAAFCFVVSCTSAVEVPSPRDVDAMIRKVPKGGLITVGRLRQDLARKFSADVTCPLTTGIFVRIAAEAAEDVIDLSAHPSMFTDLRQLFERNVGHAGAIYRAWKRGHWRRRGAGAGGISSRNGIPDLSFSLVSLMRPPSATVSPSWIATELLILRC